MGFFNSLFGGSKQPTPARFVSEGKFCENLAKQTKMSPLTVTQLRKLGVTDSTTLKLEFFFYTDKETKARGLASASSNSTTMRTANRRQATAASSW